MRAPVRTCSWRSAVVVLASGAVISLSALSGGVAPAFAKPGDRSDPGIPIIPTPEVVAPQAPRAQEQAPVEAPPAPKEAPAPPKVEASPQQAPVPVVQAPAPEPASQPQPPAPQVQAPPPQPEAPAPVQAPAPKKEAPRVVDAPKVDAPKVDPPKADAAQVDPPKANAPKADTPKVDVPQVDAPKNDAPKADQLAPAVDQPAKPGDPGQRPEGADRTQAPAAADQVKPGSEGSREETDNKQTDPSTVSKTRQRATLAAPDTLQASEPDIELARQSKPIEVKPESAKKDDVDFLSSALNIDSKTKLGPFESQFNVGSQFSVGDRDRDRDRDRDWDRDHDHDWDWDHKQWDKKVRQWDRRWIEYDEWFRPVFCNPYRAPVRIVYIYERAPRILIVPPLGRAVVDAAALGAYSFTAAVLNTANLAADVAVGTFFGGGYIPPIGAPFVPPPPLVRYDNVPVQVRYSNATYQPFRVNQIVDVGDDAQYGGRKVLLDGATPAWGQWTTSPTGERQFEVHRTQQYPGLGEPHEGPLPGDYRMQLASDESANADRTQMYLVAAAGVVAGLGLGALGLAFYLGRRRLQL